MRTLKRRLLRTALALGTLGLLAVNGVAWLQVGSMTTWAEAGERTVKPEELAPLQKLGVMLTGISIPRPENWATPENVGLEFDVRRFPNDSRIELEAWHVPGPDDSPRALAVLFHGYGARKDTLLTVARGLHDLDCRVLMVDFYGSGGSGGSGTTIGVREAADVAAAVERARESWPGEALLLYGQSMGGAAILRAVDRLGVEPEALVIESTFDAMLATVASRFHRMGLPATPLAHLLTFWGGVRIGGNAFAHNPVEYAASVTCPTLVLQGENDPNVSLEQARSIHDALGGWKRFSSRAKAEHEDIRTADPLRWDEDLEELLGQLAPGR